MDIPILYEDDSLLVIAKPPGVVVNNAASVKTETVQDWAALRVPGAASQGSRTGDDFASRAGIVHRLDKETSGILLIAKDPEAFEALQAAFKEREVAKTYLALVHGRVVPEEGSVSVPVGRLPWNRERFGVVPEGKPATSDYTALAYGTFRGDDVTAVSVRPKSGRTHQIRVHMKYINHPVVGDFQYAGRKLARRDRMTVPRVMLHAWKIAFRHPGHHGPVSFTAPVPEDMQRVFAACTIDMEY